MDHGPQVKHPCFKICVWRFCILIKSAVTEKWLRNAGVNHIASFGCHFILFKINIWAAIASHLLKMLCLASILQIQTQKIIEKNGIQGCDVESFKAKASS